MFNNSPLFRFSPSSVESIKNKTNEKLTIFSCPRTMSFTTPSTPLKVVGNLILTISGQPYVVRFYINEELLVRSGLTDNVTLLPSVMFPVFVSPPNWEKHFEHGSIVTYKDVSFRKFRSHMLNVTLDAFSKEFNIDRERLSLLAVNNCMVDTIVNDDHVGVCVSLWLDETCTDLVKGIFTSRPDLLSKSLRDVGLFDNKDRIVTNIDLIHTSGKQAMNHLNKFPVRQNHDNSTQLQINH